MKHPLKTPASLLLLAAFSGVLASPAAGQSFDLFAGTTERSAAARVGGVSADGRRFTGSIANQSNSVPAIWTRVGTSLEISVLPVPPDSSAFAISGNGGVVAGIRNGTTPFRWSESEGYQALQIPAGSTFTIAISTNNEGSIVVGDARFPGVRGSPARYQSIRWGTDGSYTEIGSANTLGSNQARAISRDGSTIVGWAFGNTAAYKWTEAGNIQILPYLLGSNQGNTSVAAAVSGNGQFIVGQSNDRSVIWHDGTVTELRLPNGERAFSSAEAVSDDGSVVGGALQIFTGNTSTVVAAVWTPETQFIPLTDYLASFGVQVPAGVQLTNVTGLSADGRTFVGKTSDRFDFVVTIPSPGGMVMMLGSIVLASRRRRA